MIKMMPLKQVCSGIIDCPHESPEWLSKGIPVIRNFNLVDGQIDMSDASYVDESTYTKRTRRAVPSAGDIIFSREAPIGNCAIVPADFKCCLGQRLVLLRVNRKICSPEYLLAALLSDFVKTQIFQVEKSGSIVSNFNISDLGDLIIPIIDRQESVASVSDTLNKKLLLNKNICAELEAMAKTLYDYWFTQFDFPNADGKHYRSSGGEMVWNDQLKREIPKGWDAKSISSLCDILSGYSFSSTTYSDKGKYKLITIKNVQETGINLDVDNHIECLPKNIPEFCKLSYGDILMSLTGNVGRVGIMYTKNCLLNQRVALIRPKQSYLSGYLYILFRSAQMRTLMENIATGTSQKNLSPVDTGKILIPYDEKIVNRFCDTVNVIINKITFCQKENYELTKLRDWLLPMLMNGQATVE